MKEIIGFILIIIGFVVFRISHRPIEKRPMAFDLGFFTFLLYAGLIVGGLYLIFS